MELQVMSKSYHKVKTKWNVRMGKDGKPQPAYQKPQSRERQHRQRGIKTIDEKKHLLRHWSRVCCQVWKRL